MTARCPCCRRALPDVPVVSPHALRALAFAFVERETGLRPAVLRGRRTSHEATRARALFVSIAKSFGGLDASYSRIGAWLHKNHSSIRHLWLDLVPRLMAEDEDFATACGRFLEFAAQSRKAMP